MKNQVSRVTQKEREILLLGLRLDGFYRSFMMMMMMMMRLYKFNSVVASNIIEKAFSRRRRISRSGDGGFAKEEDRDEKESR